MSVDETKAPDPSKYAIERGSGVFRIQKPPSISAGNRNSIPS